ncbi:MAG: plastocyanin/azurin family copper-binding protein, partial [Polyangiaceae bacterium]
MAPQGCPCMCACTDGGVQGDGGTTVAAALATAPLPANGAVHGTITTTPKASAANAVVYLEDAPLAPTTKMSTTIDNHMMTFSPFVTVIPVGGKVTFHNSDPFPHNVFSPDSGGFNIGVIVQHSSQVRIFKKAAAYALLCNLHPGMIGYLVVVPSGYFAKSDAHGNYTLKDVPLGTYKITAWAPRTQPSTQSIT